MQIIFALYCRDLWLLILQFFTHFLSTQVHPQTCFKHSRMQATLLAATSLLHYMWIPAGILNVSSLQPILVSTFRKKDSVRKNLRHQAFKSSTVFKWLRNCSADECEAAVSWQTLTGEDLTHQWTVLQELPLRFAFHRGCIVGTLCFEGSGFEPLSPPRALLRHSKFCNASSPHLQILTEIQSTFVPLLLEMWLCLRQLF